MKLLNLFLLACLVITYNTYLLTNSNFRYPMLEEYGGRQNISFRNRRGTDSTYGRRKRWGSNNWLPQGRHLGGRWNRWGVGFGWNRRDRYE